MARHRGRPPPRRLDRADVAAHQPGPGHGRRGRGARRGEGRPGRGPARRRPPRAGHRRRCGARLGGRGRRGPRCPRPGGGASRRRAQPLGPGRVPRPPERGRARRTARRPSPTEQPRRRSTTPSGSGCPATTASPRPSPSGPEPATTPPRSATTSPTRWRAPGDRRPRWPSASCWRSAATRSSTRAIPPAPALLEEARSVVDRFRDPGIAGRHLVARRVTPRHAHRTARTGGRPRRAAHRPRAGRAALPAQPG